MAVKFEPIQFDLSVFQNQKVKDDNFDVVKVYVSKPLLDKNEKEYVFMIFKWVFWCVKSNTMNDTLKFFFEFSLTKDSPLTKMFDGIWSVPERAIPYSNDNKPLKVNGYQRYVSPMKVLLNGFTVKAAAELVTHGIKTLMSRKGFKDEVYLPILKQQTPKADSGSRAKPSLLDILQNPEHKMWAFCKNVDFDMKYEQTLDCILVNNDIQNLTSIISGKNQRDVWLQEAYPRVMYQNYLDKDLGFD